VLLFSHHPVSRLYDQKQRIALTDIVTSSPNVIGYFAGHTHNSGLRTIRPIRVDADHHAKWEVIAPSVIDYPQAVRQLTIKSIGGLGYVDVLTFSPLGTGLAAEKVKAAERGAIRDKCENNRALCDDAGRIRLPAREVTFPRLFFRMPTWDK
jgi:hypothetical protein